MRNRHFSPQMGSFSPTVSYLSPSHGRLKMVGSSSKLSGFSSSILPQSQLKIGNYSYSNSKQIGSGYSSKVYKGYNIKDNSECAIKIIELKRYSEQSLKMLDNQIKILKTLDHPNIIKCYDIYKTQTHCYIVTELCSHGDLLNYLTRRGKLDENVAVEIMAEVVEGVKYLIKNGIMHRDLKPANILNNKVSWKIADFGFSMYCEREIKTRYNVGTPLYMPLQSLVKNVYSPLSDIFSVGVIFYELLTGITPWQCKNQKELIKKMNNLPYSLSQRFNVSQPMRSLLQRLCAKESEKRMQKPEFMALRLKKEKDEEQTELQLRNTSKLMVQKSRSDLGDDFLKSNSSINMLSSKSILSQKQLDSKQETKNNHILISQLHYCRFIYYLCRNISFLKLADKSKSKILLLLYKHLQKLIKNLADNSANWFNIKNWDAFKQTRKYYTTHLTMKEYALRYEKQYLTLLKKTELNTVRDINKELTQLSTPEAFTAGGYRKILNAVAPMVREANHNTTMALAELNNVPNSEIKGSIEAIRSLHKYYKLVEMSMEHFEDYESFEKKSSIKVQIDYKNTQNATLEAFTQLRQQIKFI